MCNLINIKNLSFSYGKKKIFENLNLTIKSNSWLTVIGPNGSGKSTLAKLIVDTYPYNGIIEIKNDENKIGIVYASSDLNFFTDTVDKEISMSRKNLDISISEFNEKKNKIINLLNLEKVIDCKPSELSNSFKVLVSFASILVYEPKILILDGTLDELDYMQKKKVIKILKSYYKKGMTIINITQDIENTLIGNDILLIADKKVIFYDNKEKFFEEEKMIKQYGINLPFVVDLSLKLKYYDMVDKLYYNMKDLVDAVWK